MVRSEGKEARWLPEGEEKGTARRGEAEAERGREAKRVKLNGK